MHVENPEVQDALHRITCCFTRDLAFRDDLLQEALIHLWRMEERRPGQSVSWYLQSARFHLLHYVASGRSIDSYKRRADLVQLDHTEADGEPANFEEVDRSYVLSAVSARELVTTLANHLENGERRVLDCLIDGLGAREIGRRLGISHTMALKYRSRIAELVRGLERPVRGVPVIFNGGNGSRVMRAQ